MNYHYFDIMDMMEAMAHTYTWYANDHIDPTRSINDSVT